MIIVVINLDKEPLIFNRVKHQFVEVESVDLKECTLRFIPDMNSMRSVARNQGLNPDFSIMHQLTDEPFVEQIKETAQEIRKNFN